MTSSIQSSCDMLVEKQAKITFTCKKEENCAFEGHY